MKLPPQRTLAEKGDVEKAWLRSDEDFFAAGACHVLAHAFLTMYPDAGYRPMMIVPATGYRGRHVIAASRDHVFDFNGYTEREFFLAELERLHQQRDKGWCAQLVELHVDPAGWDFCRQHRHRHPSQFFRNPVARARAFIHRAGPPPRCPPEADVPTSYELKYVPENYRQVTSGATVFWVRDARDLALAGAVNELLDGVQRQLSYELKRQLHVVVYASNSDARRALSRNLHPSALLAPLHAATFALVALQSAAAHARNADERRMRRHLAHELAHVFSAERTHSTKYLGDTDANMRLLPWVDEGFAEVVAALVGPRPDVFDAALQRASCLNMDDARMNAVFRDLNSPERADASAVATARVWRAARLHGLDIVFDNLQHPERWACW